ncbi:unnamed protein product [Clavelina lepadiformis]|uniref:Caspase-3 n=1 Tax=Clavelina lepadiformis TaxID=159417 RepID=A0ABP0GCE0_CLALP
MGAKCAVGKKSAMPKAFYDFGSVDKDLGVYNTEEKNGRAYIFNHYKFKTKIAKRKGTDKDVSNLKTIFEKIGIKCKVFNDLPIRQVRDELEKISKKEFSDYSCCFVVFLSHGQENYIWTNDDKLLYNEVSPYFTSERCESLEGKPKIFIVQACKGNNSATPAEKTTENPGEQTDAEEEKEEKEDGVSPAAPIGADCISCFASATGYVSYRNEYDGSRFIQTLTSVVMEYISDSDWKLDFASLMTIVAERVSAIGSDKTKQRQMPCTVSTLRKRFYLPKIDDLL